MSDPNCKTCKKLFTEQVKRVKGRNICGKCNYQEQKARDFIKNAGINEKICNTCNILRPISGFSTPGHRKCRYCPVKKRKPLDYTKLFCKVCGINLTPQTKTSGKNQCKYCTNLYANKRIKKVKDTNISQKTCRKCLIIKPISKFRSVFHYDCINCDSINHKKITEEDWLKYNPHIKEKSCIICKELRPINRFSYHTTNYRNQCKNCLNKFKRYIQTRLRKIERIGITAYRKENAITHSNWIINNYEHWKSYCNVYLNSMEGRCSMHFSSAKRRNLIDKNMTAKQFKNMVIHFIKKPCYYCNTETKNGSLEKMIAGKYNGIDRIDSKKCYSYDNCVSCCTHCNIMKNSSDIASFIRKCCEITYYNNLVNLDINTDYRLKLHKNVKLVGGSASYSKYKNRAKKKQISFNLCPKIFYKITNSPCYLCGESGKNGIGIDRFDNTIGYTKKNSKPCCNYCNYMKNKWEYNVFLNKVKEIVICTYNKECVKKFCINSKINYICNGKFLPYNNDINDIYDILK